MFAMDLAAALEGTGVTVTCLHPVTYVDTTMVWRAGVTPLSTVEEGAQAVRNLATSPAVEGRTGLYFNGCVRQKRRPKPTMRMRVGASRR
jgi:NAD(P)-dependent dehydrogenase (short-subunit alcohol dehydrogenase family)